jgi:PAS domain S-box-containing protein
MLLASSAAVLLLAIAIFVIYDVLAFRRSHIRDVSTLAEMIAENVNSSLSFQNQEDAKSVLGTLRAEPAIRMAALYDTNGAVFARYPAELKDAALPAAPGIERTQYENGKVVTVRPVLREDNAKRVGTLYVEAELTPVYRRIQVYLMMAAGILILSFCVAYFLSFWLQRRVTNPILDLADTASRITNNKDFSIRAQLQSDDEIGGLTTAFNTMLTEIGTRDAALRESADRLQLALEASQTGTWDWDLQTNRLAWDAHVHQLFGIKAEEFKGTFEDFQSHIHPEDRARVDAALRRAIEKKRDLYVEFRVLWPDGTVHHMASRGRAFSDEKGKPVRMTGVLVDVTEGKKAEQALRESEERFRNMADAAPVMIWTAGPDRSIEYVNKAWTEFTGRTRDQEIGTGWGQAVHPDDRDAFLTQYNECFEGHREFRAEFRLRRADGQYRAVRGRGVPRFAPDGSFRGFIGSCIDITDIREAQNELERRVQSRTAELAETNRELEAFTYSVSHDLRAPLRHINAYAQVLEEDYGEKLDTEAKKYLSRIQGGAKRMGALVDDLLNLARVGRQEIAVQEFPLDGIVQEIVQEMIADYPERKITWKIEPLGTAVVDPGLIKQVFTNLISNAVKYTRPRPEAVIQIGRNLRDGRDVFFVKDNGVGFDMKYASKLFGVFQRLHRAEDFEGTGVGLAIVERIVRRHGGEIWAEAAPDKGAAFYFTLGGQGQTT